MAFQEPAEAPGAANAEQPPAAPKETQQITSSSSDQVHLLQGDGSKDSTARSQVFRLMFCGKTVFEHRSSTSCYASSLPSSSGDNDLHLPPRPVVPDWVMDLASRCRAEGDGPVVEVAAAAEPQFLMTKKVTKTDLKSDDNCLIVPAGFVNSSIIPLLSDDEKKAASLDEYSNKKRKIRKEKKRDPTSSPRELEEGGGEELQQPSKLRKTMGNKGWQHRGLEVTAWTKSRWFFNELRLTCWDEEQTVLKGEHLKYLYDRSFLREGDQIELWAFRDVRRQLHLALHKAASSSIS